MMKKDSVLNQGLVLKTIEENGKISRADIARKTKLSPPTVSKIVQRLIDKNIVTEIGPGSSSGGKRPILLTINPKSTYVVSVDLGSGEGIKAALVDLSYNITKQIVIPRKDDKKLSFYLTLAVRKLLDDIDFPQDKIVGVCIGVPGIVDFKQRKVTVAPYLNWEIPFEDLELEEIEMPVEIENDVNLMALGEKAKGIAKKVKNFVFIGERVGIGAGIVIDGKLYTGAHSAAGEVGYLIIDPKYSSRDNKDFGCFEKLVGSQAILNKIKKKIGKELKTIDVFKLAGEDSSIATKIVKETLKFLAYGINNISCVLDPELVIIGGAISILPNNFLEEIKNYLQRITPFVPRVEVSKLGEDGVLIGAAVKVFEPLKVKGFVGVK